MKLIFLFFAAINIAFFIWQSESLGLGHKSGPSKGMGATNVPTLVLLGEADAIKNADANPKNPPEKTASLAPENIPPANKLAACFSLGPFDNVEQALPISAKLRDLGTYTSERKEKEKTTSGYWVYLPSFDSWKDAREKVMELEKKGLKDIFIVGRGKMKNAVSLGLFSSDDAADRRVEKLQKLGIKPKIEVQYTTAENYWIDIDIEKGHDDVAASVQGIAEGLTSMALKKRACN